MKIHYGGEFENTLCGMDPTEPINSGSRATFKEQWGYTHDWKRITCKLCIKKKPAPASPPCHHPAKQACQLCLERFCPNDGCDPNHRENCREANRP